ncbi:MAG: HAD family hydrolase [Lachnospiraceae bacterium]
MDKQYILFDLDGTLTDPMVGITKSVQYALKHFGIEVNDLKKLTPFIGPPLKDSFMERYDFSEEEAEEAVRIFREYFVPQGMFENEPYEGIKDFLEHLVDAGKVLFVATSKPVDFAERILEKFDLDQYFEYICGATIDEKRTSKIDVIAYLIEECQLIDMDELIMVGDTKYDIWGAKEFGIRSVGVLYGYGDRDELEEAGADYIAKNLEELEEILLEED